MQLKQPKPPRLLNYVQIQSRDDCPHWVYSKYLWLGLGYPHPAKPHTSSQVTNSCSNTSTSLLQLLNENLPNLLSSSQSIKLSSWSTLCDLRGCGTLLHEHNYVLLHATARRNKLVPFVTRPLTGAVTSSTCVCVCVVNGLSVQAATQSIYYKM